LEGWRRWVFRGGKKKNPREEEKRYPRGTRKTEKKKIQTAIRKGENPPASSKYENPIGRLGPVSSFGGERKNKCVQGEAYGQEGGKRTWQRQKGT